MSECLSRFSERCTSMSSATCRSLVYPPVRTVCSSSFSRSVSPRGTRTGRSLVCVAEGVPRPHACRPIVSPCRVCPTLYSVQLFATSHPSLSDFPKFVLNSRAAFFVMIPCRDFQPRLHEILGNLRLSPDSFRAQGDVATFSCALPK